jgi:hypothetical protein
VIQLRALACLAVLCLGAPRSAGPGAMPRVEAYVWQRVWTPEVLTTLQSDSAFITRWHILVAQGSSGTRFRRFTPDWSAVGRSGRPATPVIRIDGQLDGATSPALARDIATLFLALPAPFRDRIEIDHEAIRPRALRPPADWSNRGQMSGIVLSILRQGAEPMTTRDIAMELLVARAMDKGDQKLFKLTTKRVGVALRTQRDTGVVRSEQGPGMLVLWQIDKNPI